MIKDLIVEEARRVQAELIKKYGGLDGWIDHLQEMDRQRLEKERKRKAAAKKKQAASTTKSKNGRGGTRASAVNGKKPAKKGRGRKSQTASR
jgi:hypothetical protein